MISGNERSKPSAANVQKLLCNVWPDYKKPVDAQTLATKFLLEDLIRLAQFDTELKILLSMIGLYK